MVQFGAFRSIRKWFAAVTVVFGCLFLIPCASQAACGDYLQTGGGSVPTFHSMSHGLTRIQGNLTGAPSRGVPRQPCHGPACSKHSFPSPGQVPIVIDTDEQWALVSANTFQNLVDFVALLAQPSGLVVDGFRLSILRPPR